MALFRPHASALRSLRRSLQASNSSGLQHPSTLAWPVAQSAPNLPRLLIRLHTHSSHNHFTSSLESNKKWAASVASAEPGFFPAAEKGQAPKILWLGCSDSRIPETTVLGLKPGDVFTHRNIANIVNPTDVSMLSVVEYAVAHLKVEHVVVCGHTSCGGVAATLANGRLGVIDVWLQPMRALREQHADALDKLQGADKTTRMAELNVQAGVGVLRRIPTVIDAMKERGLQVHGLLYNLGSGRLTDVECPEDDKTGSARIGAFETK